MVYGSTGAACSMMIILSSGPLARKKSISLSLWMILYRPLNNVGVCALIPISLAIWVTLSIFWLRADREFWSSCFLCSNMLSIRKSLRLAISLCVLMLLSIALSAGLLDLLRGLEAVVLVLLALLLPMLSGVSWSSYSSSASSLELPPSKSIVPHSPATKEVEPSTVFPVNILSIWSKYSGKPFLNFIKSDCPCNMKSFVMQCFT